MDINIEQLHQTVRKMLAPGRGLLAADESNKTAAKRLTSVGVENTEEMRRQYRDLFLSTEGIEKYINGVILYDETIRQKANGGTPFAELLEKKGIVPGIKVDMSTIDMPGFPGEKITTGLDGLRDRLKEYYEMGARFTKWRAVIAIGEGIPTQECIHTNAMILALYARIAQEEGFVPIVEPEVLLNGTHTLEKAEEVTTKTVSHVMYEIGRMRVDLSGVILKTSMVVDGGDDGITSSNKDVAESTVRMLKNTCPDNLGGVVFLSGGQSPEEAAQHLNAIAEKEPLPWELAFSYARAIQGPALKVWKGKKENVPVAREAFIEWLQKDVKADQGEL